MLPFSYLVLGVNPVSNESNVELSSKITITFAKHIDPDTLNANTIRVRKVNGDFIEYTGKYSSANKTYEITPNAPLAPSTQYQTMILGEVEGVVSIDGSYIPTTKTYEFVTVSAQSITPVANLQASQEYLFAVAKWDMPDGLIDGESLYFNIRLSTLNNPEAADIWPVNPLEGKTTATNLTIPHKLEADHTYFVHVQAVTDSTTTEWVSAQVYIASPSTGSGGETTPEEPATESPDAPIESYGQLAIVDHFPQSGELSNPSEILVLFSSPIDPTLFIEGEQSNLLYVVEAINKQSLSVLDLRTAYSFSKAIPGNIVIDPENPNLLVFVPTEGPTAFRESKEYTVIVSKDLKGVDGLPIGYTFSYSFTGTPANLFGDIVQIQETISKYGLTFTTRFLQSLMRKHSQFAVDVWTESATFDEALLEDGGAPYFIHEYVNTQVLIDALLNGGTSATAGTGNETLKLGELSVSKEAGESKADSISSVLAQLGVQLKMWTDMIHGYTNRGYAKPLTAVKGEASSPYPDYLTRSTLLDFDA